MKYLSVEKGNAETVRRRLMGSGHLDPSRQIIREGGRVLFPVMPDVPKEIGELIEHRDGKPRELRPSWYGDIANVPEGLKPHLPRSFDAIGHVAVMKIPDDIRPYAGEVADAILACNPAIATVAIDEGIHGEDRVRTLKVVRGTETETEYVEYGTRMLVDPTKVFFTPRLGFERWRVASLVTPFEKVLDMFAGVGPFSLHICRRAPSAEVYAVDSNPHAVEYMKANAKLNRVNNLHAISGKIEDVMKDLPTFDRAIMNLPMRSVEHIPLALSKIGEGWLHIYWIVDNMDDEVAMQEIRKRIETAGRGVGSISVREVKSYAPGVRFLSFDVSVIPT